MISANNHEPSVKAGQATETVTLHALITCPFSLRAFSIGAPMANSQIYDEWGSFAAIPHQFIDAAGQYSDHARWLFVLLRRYTNGESGKAFPSYVLIEEHTGWSPKTIAKAIRELEAGGWIIRKKQFSGPTIYKLVRPQNFPEGSNDSTSPREVSYFPEGSNALPYGKSKKTDNKKTNSKKTECGDSSRAIPARPHTPQTDQDAVSIALSIFPTLGIWQQEVIANGDIKQFHLWRKALEDWRDNRYSLRNITGLIDSYYRLEKMDNRDKEYRNNGTNRPVRESHNERAIRETVEYIGRLTGTPISDSNTHSADTIFKLPPAFGGE